MQTNQQVHTSIIKHDILQSHFSDRAKKVLARPFDNKGRQDRKAAVQ